MEGLGTNRCVVPAWGEGTQGSVAHSGLLRKPMPEQKSLTRRPQVPNHAFLDPFTPLPFQKPPVHANLCTSPRNNRAG